MRCLLVDDSPEFLASATRLLKLQGAEVVGVASSGKEALRLAEALGPDVVLLDVELGDEDGVALVDPLRERAAESTVILISIYEREEMAELISIASAKFLPKSALSASAIASLLRAA